MARPGWLGALGLAAAVALLWLPSLRNGFVYDDHEVILAHPAKRSAAELAHVFAEPHSLPFSRLPYYRPVTRFTFELQKSVHGDVPAPFHALNALLGGAVAAAALALLRAPALRIAPAPALVAAALFAVHPVASSTVLPIASGRETLLPTLFALLCVAFHLRAGAAARAAAVASFAAAFFGKEQWILLPALLGVADLLRLAPAPPGRSPLRWAMRYAPFAGVVLVNLFVRSQLFEPAPPALLRRALAERPTGPLESYAFALQVWLVPFRGLVYEPDTAAWWSPGRLGVAVALAATLVVATLRLVPAARRPVAFWAAWFLLLQALTANFLPQETRFDERFTFAASLALPALAATLLSSPRLPVRARRLGLAAGTACALGAAALSLGRVPAFADEVAFARRWAETSPAHANAHASLGTALARSGSLDEAAAALERAVRLAPRDTRAHFNRAVVLAEMGRLDAAASGFRDVLALDPDDADAHENLALLLARAGRSEEAATHERAATALRAR
jgi:tetratricopeptide (TPR) repeat protein